MFYTLVRNGEEANITVFIPGHNEPYQAHSTHPNFDHIINVVVNDGDEALLPDLFDVEQAVAKRFESLSERVAVRNGQVYFDGDVVDNALTKQIVRFLDEDVNDWGPLVNFMEKVESNPQDHSREQLYRWLERHDFTITPEGDFVGYKGVRIDDDGNYTSISCGPAIVDGEEVNGYVPNDIGSTVEIARSYVDHDPARGCSQGLHVGTHAYAQSWSGQVGAVLEVHVNPRDVVSVPTDCNDQKVRTCRYVVVDVIDEPYASAVTEDYAWSDDDDFDFDWLDELEEDVAPASRFQVGDRVGGDELIEEAVIERVCGGENYDIKFRDESRLTEWHLSPSVEKIDEPEEETASGFPVGTQVRLNDDEWNSEYWDYREGVVGENTNGISSLVRVVWPDGTDDFFYPDEIAAVAHASQPQSYYGHEVGERWQQPLTGAVFTVCVRPTNPKEYGYDADTIPLIRDDDGTHDAVMFDQLDEDWVKLS